MGDDIKEMRVVFTDKEHKFLTDIKNKFNCKNNHDFIIVSAKALEEKGKVESE